MLKRTLLASAAALAMIAATAPAHAVSIMYAEWLSSLVEPGIAAYEAATGEKVEAIKLPGTGYDQRTSLDLSAGTAADVIQMDSFMVSEFAASGYLEPLTEQAKGWDQYQYYMPGLLEVASYDGNVYALPTDTDVRMLWYDKSNFEKAGIPTPWEPKNWADVLDAAQKLKDTGVPYFFQLPAHRQRFRPPFLVANDARRRGRIHQQPGNWHIKRVRNSGQRLQGRRGLVRFDLREVSHVQASPLANLRQCQPSIRSQLAHLGADQGATSCPWLSITLQHIALHKQD